MRNSVIIKKNYKPGPKGLNICNLVLTLEFMLLKGLIEISERTTLDIKKNKPQTYVAIPRFGFSIFTWLNEFLNRHKNTIGVRKAAF